MLSNIKLPKHTIFIETISSKLHNQTTLYNNLSYNYLERIQHRFNRIGDLYTSYDYHNVLKRGYAILYQDNKIISDTKKIKTDNHLVVKLRDGKCTVNVKG